MTATNEIMRDCLLRYGTYVIEDRAIPDVRDGLKPVQRRLLWSMWQLKLRASTAPTKSARVVGDTLGRFHPHGDAATYDALVNLTAAHVPFVDGYGNFGDRQGLIEKPPAKYRYTECKLHTVAETFFDDIHVIDKVPTYDNSGEEPRVLPARFPVALVNGANGIAFALKTSIPSHNINEVIDATIHLIKNPTATVSDLLRFIKGPDYGTGILVSGKEDLLELYEKGEGQLTYNSNYHIEDSPVKGVKRLVITGLAPDLSKNVIIKTCQELHAARLLESPVIQDSTIEEGYRDLIEYKDPKIVEDRVLPLLMKKVNYQWYLLDENKRPVQHTLLSYLERFIDFRRQVETDVLNDRKAALIKRVGTEQVKYKAARNLVGVAKILQQKLDTNEQKLKLQELLNVEPWQADVLLETKLASLSRLSAVKVKAVIEKLKAEIKVVKAQLKDIDSVVIARLEELRKFSSKRGTKLRSKKESLGGSFEYWLGVTDTGKIDVSEDLPLKSRAAWNYVDLQKSTGSLVIVHETNIANVVDISYLDQYSPSGAVVGFSANAHCLVVASDGSYCLFPTDQKRKKFNVFSKFSPENSIVAALPLDTATDRVLLWFANGKLMWVDSLKVTRPNIRGNRLYKKSAARVLREVKVVRPGDVVFGGSKRLSDSAKSTSDLNVYHKDNNLVIENNVRSVKPLDSLDLSADVDVRRF